MMFDVGLVRRRGKMGDLLFLVWRVLCPCFSVCGFILYVWVIYVWWWVWTIIICYRGCIIWKCWLIWKNNTSFPSRVPMGTLVWLYLITGRNTKFIILPYLNIYLKINKKIHEIWAQPPPSPSPRFPLHLPRHPHTKHNHNRLPTPPRLPISTPTTIIEHIMQKWIRSKISIKTTT